MSGDWLGIAERARRHRSDRTGQLAIAIHDVGDVVVVYVVDYCGVDHRVADVDAGEVVLTDRVAWSIHVARSEREPSDARDRPGREREAEAATTDEGDQRRC